MSQIVSIDLASHGDIGNASAGLEIEPGVLAKVRTWWT
jgi:hypothetical protein